MLYRYLGGTGLQVSEICIGSMQFKWTTDEATSYKILDAFYEAGGNFIDTADIYSRWAEGLKGGEAETIIGVWDGPNGEGLSRAHLMQAVEDSLRRLQTEYIDLYQSHWPDDNTPVEETMRALDDLVRQGKGRYVGCSNYNGWQLMEAALGARHAGLSEYISVQPPWWLVEREEFEKNVLPVATKLGIGIL